MNFSNTKAGEIVVSCPTNILSKGTNEWYNNYWPPCGIPKIKKHESFSTGTNSCNSPQGVHNWWIKCLTNCGSIIKKCFGQVIVQIWGNSPVYALLVIYTNADTHYSCKYTLFIGAGYRYGFLNILLQWAWGLLFDILFDILTT